MKTTIPAMAAVAAALIISGVSAEESSLAAGRPTAESPVRVQSPDKKNEIALSLSQRGVELAVLKVGVNGDFAATNVDWHVVSGPGKVVSTNGWYATVVATGMGEDVTVEARFNGDEIQPRFVLPVVEERVLHIKAFTVSPPGIDEPVKWTNEEITTYLDTANEIFSQVGIKFVLDEIRVAGSDDGEDWNLTSTQAIVRPDGTKRYRLTDQTISLLDTCQSNDCIKVFFLGMIRSAIGEKLLHLRFR